MKKTDEIRLRLSSAQIRWLGNVASSLGVSRAEVLRTLVSTAILLSSTAHDEVSGGATISEEIVEMFRRHSNSELTPANVIPFRRHPNRHE